MESILRDMQTKNLVKYVEAEFGVNLFENNPENYQKSKKSLDLHMQLSYKQEVELAEEQAINTLLEGNKYDLTKKRCTYDLATTRYWLPLKIVLAKQKVLQLNTLIQLI